MWAVWKVVDGPDDPTVITHHNDVMENDITTTDL